jgi:arsenical pump membrane protein
MFSDCLIWIISIASILCVLARPWSLAEAWWACGGAVLLILCTLISIPDATRAALKGTDVYLFLTGMMILSELAREEGVFDWIAEVAAGHATGSTRRLFLLIYLAGTGVTIFLSNDATAVVLTPAVLTIVRRLKVDPTPHLIACAFIANAASFVLPISNPANLVIFDEHMPPLFQWLGTFAVPSLAAILVTYFVLRLVLKKGLEVKIGESLPRTRLSIEGRLALAGLVLAALSLVTASALGWPLGAPTCGASVIALGIVATRDRKAPRNVIAGVSWSVLPLVAGLFVIVEALEHAGMLKLAMAGLNYASHLSGILGNLVIGFTVGLLSNAMNNLPVGLISGTAVQAAHASNGLANAILIGVDLGPNLTVTGSLATILWLIALRRENVRITGWQFAKVGILAMPLALLVSLLFLTRH